jgi:hypothetical protein
VYGLGHYTKGIIFHRKVLRQDEISCTYDMLATNKKVEDEEIASYILAGLDMDSNHVVSAMAARVESPSPGFTPQLVSWEQKMHLLHGGSGSSANVATHGGRGGFNRDGGRRGGRSHGRGNSGSGGLPEQNSNVNRPT